MTGRLSKPSLWTGAALAALALAQPASAQDENEATGSDAIVVTGIRGSLERATEIKRRAPVIADVIGATGLGRFPDENVAESLQRITGVQIQRLRGEGSKVSIRGLPPEFTGTTLNGRDVANAFNLQLNGTASRDFEFSALPSEFVNTLEVYKSPMASLREGGLAGTVIIRTPSPLDIGKRRIALSAQGAYESNSGNVAPRVAGLYSDVFADGTLGVTLGAAYTERDSESHAHLSRGFRASRQFTQNILLLERFEEEKKRLSLLGKVEWEPTDELRLFVDGFYTDLDNISVRSAAAFNFGNTIGRVSASSPEQIVESGTTREDVNGDLLTTRLQITNLELRPGGRVQKRDGHTSAYATGAHYQAGAWDISAEFNISHSEQVADDINVLAQGFISEAGYDATIDNQVTSLILPGTAASEALDPDNFRLLNVFGGYGSEIEDDIWAVKLDVAREFEMGLPFTLRFGASYTEREQFGFNQRLDTSTSDINAELGLGDAPAFPGSFAAGPLLQVVSAGKGTYLGAYNGDAFVPETFFATDARGVVAQIGRERLGEIGTLSINGPATVNVQEDVLAFYGQLDFETFDGLISGNVGLRVVNTDQTTQGIAPDLTGITFQPDAGALIRIPAGEPISVARSYTNYLPAANLQVELAEDFLVRFAASRTMTRPTLQRISPSTTTSNVPPTLNRNNPFLDPFLSDNFDMSFEWYFDQGSLFSVTLFYKDLVSLVQPITENIDLPVTFIFGDGTQEAGTLEFIDNSFENGEGANLKGAEFTFQHSFDGLPGPLSDTGVLLNYTYIDNSDPEQIVGASKNNFNVSGYYEGDDLAIRLSYTWRSRFLLNPGAQERFGQFVSAGGVLDGNISYNITDNFSVVLEAINILDKPISTVDGNNFPAIYEDNGRRILFGAKASF